MAKTHLRPQSGGDPAQGPADDLKNEPVAPSADNDFPDAPDQAPDDAPQDKPDLDAFAKRMGTDTIATGDGLDAVPEQRSTDEVSEGPDSRLIIGAGGVAIAAVLIAVIRRRKRRNLLSKAVALGAAAKVIRD